jgi:hypothetical protein
MGRWKEGKKYYSKEIDGNDYFEQTTRRLFYYVCVSLRIHFFFTSMSRQ